mmetsp:Transcript_17574/g.30773  ORF Transcript_17574/g.30773 Transcript_17574/m.30773 type:complete len:180 (-) Transcript_17574:1335-1874(-)
MGGAGGERVRCAAEAGHMERSPKLGCRKAALGDLERNCAPSIPGPATATATDPAISPGGIPGECCSPATTPKGALAGKDGARLMAGVNTGAATRAEEPRNVSTEPSRRKGGIASTDTEDAPETLHWSLPRPSEPPRATGAVAGVPARDSVLRASDSEDTLGLSDPLRKGARTCWEEGTG